MSGYLDGIITGTAPPGRYRLTAAVTLRSLTAELDAAGWAARVVDGATMADRVSMFAVFGTALGFPPGTGRNWDAFHDRLRDLSWIDAAGIVVFWWRGAAFASVAGRDLWDMTGEVIDGAIEERVTAGAPPLYVVYPAPAEAGPSGGAESMLRPVR